jgi:succinoglycan biosynthesis transport protein ExoP
MARPRQTLRQDYDLVLLAALPAQAVTGCAYRRRPCRRDPALGAVARHARNAVLHALELLEEAHANVVAAALTQVGVNIHVRSGYPDAEVYHLRDDGHARE